MEFSQLFNGLTADEQTVLEMLSVLYVPASSTGLLQALSSCGFQIEGVGWTRKTLHPVLDHLREFELIEFNESRYSVKSEYLESITREAAKSGKLARMKGVFNNTKVAESTRGEDKHDLTMRVLRLAVHLPDRSAFMSRLTSEDWKQVPRPARQAFFSRLLLSPFEIEWVEGLPKDMLDILAYSVEAGISAEGNGPFLDWLTEYTIENEKTDRLYTPTRLRLVWRSLMLGHLETARTLLEPMTASTAELARGFLNVMIGEHAQAVSHYERGVTQADVDTNSDFYLFHALSLVGCERLEEAAAVARSLPSTASSECLQLAVRVARGIALDSRDLDCTYPLLKGTGIPTLLSGAVQVWYNPKEAQPIASILEDNYQSELTAERRWMAAEYASLLAKINPNSDWPNLAASLHADCQTKSLLTAIEIPDSWQHTLMALESLELAPVLSTEKTRLIWLASLTQRGDCLSLCLTPREQRQARDGSWTGGRAVALHRLSEDWRSISYLNDVDRRICKDIECLPVGPQGSLECSINPSRAAAHLVGHPLVFLASNPELRIEVITARPVLKVEQYRGDWMLRIEPSFPSDGELAYWWDGQGLLKLVSFNPVETRIAQLIEEGCRVPASQQARLDALLGSLAKKITVHSDSSANEEQDLLECDGTLHVHISPLKSGLQGRFWVRPLGEDGPLYSPCSGSSIVMAEIEGRTLKARRNLKRELATWFDIQSACQHLPEISPEERWEISDPAVCLELLLELEAFERVTLHWPEGASWRVRRFNWADFRIKISAERDWFVVGADIEIDEGELIHLQALLDASANGGFVPLGKNQFAALSQEFARRLEDLRCLSEAHNDGLRVNGMLAALVAEAVQGARLEVDEAWKKHLEKKEDSRPALLPSTFKAQLRDYQLDGFRWLVHLANLGCGACLADDMGLGKTVQALALMLTRAGQGPALVVAPTSVCANWAIEIARFAPTLRPQLYAGSNRKLSEELGPFDVVLTSYSLMVQDAEELISHHWATVVLDEAQAIKNATTRRSQAVMALKADFRLITTGTPIENHLGELWNLFHFLNPSLLGSMETFNQRFASHIEAGNREAGLRLKRLLSPFLLRRTKTQVLQELPSRTEVTIQVELSESERALYEAIRRSALENLSEVSDQSRGASVRIFAELMKLRRACCHPSLVTGEAGGTASKLEAFSEILEEMLENGHKALVFSQFIDHLAIVREHLEKRGIVYQYLDGATPMRDRQRRVEAFQAGEGEVFLISLRAGGTGLNLTAADYVIHLDPWWNPAVEDQASDRAHRMGQKRPVTIYRLVAKNSVEERILELHKSKRELADSLLDGNEVANRLSAKELMKLFGQEEPIY